MKRKKVICAGITVCTMLSIGLTGCSHGQEIAAEGVMDSGTISESETQETEEEKSDETEGYTTIYIDVEEAEDSGAYDLEDNSTWDDSNGYEEFPYDDAHIDNYEDDWIFEIDEDGEVVHDDESGLSYIKNQIILSVIMGIDRETVEILAESIDAKVVGYIELVNYYQLEFNTDKTYDELNEMINNLEELNFVDHASFNWVSGISLNEE